MSSTSTLLSSIEKSIGEDKDKVFGKADSEKDKHHDAEEKAYKKIQLVTTPR